MVRFLYPILFVGLLVPAPVLAQSYVTGVIGADIVRVSNSDASLQGLGGGGWMVRPSIGLGWVF